MAVLFFLLSIFDKYRRPADEEMNVNRFYFPKVMPIVDMLLLVMLVDTSRSRVAAVVPRPQARAVSFHWIHLGLRGRCWRW